MENTQHGAIMKELGNLNGKMDGMVKQQMITNGKVAANEGRLNHMDVEDGKLGVFLEQIKSNQAKENSLKNKWLDRILMFVFMGFLQLGLLLLIRSGIINLEKEPKTMQEKQEALIEATSEAQKLQLELLNK